MIELPLLQLSGAVAGGIVGGFSGFVANFLQEQKRQRQTRRNVAAALIGEIEALCEYLQKAYLSKLRPEARNISDDASDIGSDYRYYYFRGERDYMPVFRSLGSVIGCLPSPMPRALVSWYTELAVCLERARELHELAQRSDAKQMKYAIQIAQIQHAAFTELASSATPLLERLSKL